MKTLIAVLILLSSCSGFRPRRSSYAKPAPRIDVRQNNILRCTNLFIDKGVEFDSAVKGCKDHIYYK